jgi:hypothetical protein
VCVFLYSDVKKVFAELAILNMPVTKESDG